MFNLYGGYKAFTLKFGGKNLSFDCHRKFLETDHLYRHNRYGFRKMMSL